MSVTLTVFTPTYNRADCLFRCYQSLCRQTCKDFQWLIIDDGSMDNTFEIVRNWISRDNGFEIIYVYKDNGGVHTAHNTAYHMMDTELNVCIDSDDYMTDDAVESIIKLWREKKSPEYSGIVALDCFSDGRVIGSRLPEQKAIRLCDYYYHGGKGDKKLVFRTQVMQELPDYPAFKGETLVPLGYKYLLADQKYKLLILNKPICVVEYREDGLTRNIFRSYARNPKGFALDRINQMKYAVGFINRYKACIHYVSCSIFARNWFFLKETPRKLMTVSAIIPGILLNLYIRYKLWLS